MAERSSYQSILDAIRGRTGAIFNRDEAPVPAPKRTKGAGRRANTKDNALTSDQVRGIRRLVASGKGHKEAGEAYGVGETVVTQIIEGFTYQWVKDDAPYPDATFACDEECDEV